MRDRYDKVQFAKDILKRYESGDLMADEVEWPTLIEVLEDYVAGPNAPKYAGQAMPFQGEGSYWYWRDEVGELQGPYRTQEEAGLDLEYHCRFVLGDGEIKGAN